ncbi:MAG: energy transducer TonB, partial [Treponema sp.]|nr:energy transducer TonB [Treponema sp.]
MDKIARTRILLFIIVASLHGFLIFFLVFRLNAAQPEIQENAQVMKLADIEEFEELPPAPPPPPPPSSEPVPDNAVESIAENIIETDEEPDQTVLAPGTLLTAPPVMPPVQFSGGEEYLPMHKISVPPKLLNERDIAATLRGLYPPIALRSGIEGRVILELFVDMNGEVRRLEILQETPKDRG